MLGGHFWSIFMLSQVNVDKLYSIKKWSLLFFPLKPKRCCFVANGLASNDSINLNPWLERKIHAIC